jgi:hypothetical protein
MASGRHTEEKKVEKSVVRDVFYVVVVRVDVQGTAPGMLCTVRTYIPVQRERAALLLVGALAQPQACMHVDMPTR